MRLIKAFSTLFVLLSLVSFNAYAQDAEPTERKKGRKGPPPEALVACENLQEGDACSFTSKRRGDVTGVCIVPKKDDSLLACKPPKGERK